MAGDVSKSLCDCVMCERVAMSGGVAGWNVHVNLLSATSNTVLWARKIRKNIEFSEKLENKR